MKKIFLLNTSFLLLFGLNSCCPTCENVRCNQAPLYNKGFDMPNLITILNPKDSFNVNDTLWMRIEFPTSFFGDKKSCAFNGNSIEIGSNIYCIFDSSDNKALFSSSSSIFSKIGYYITPSGYYFFDKRTDNYIAEFGLLLSDKTLNFIGIDTTNEFSVFYGNRLFSRQNTGCTYDDDDCAVGKKRHPYTLGFNINTSFQGGVKRWKINMRK